MKRKKSRKILWALVVLVGLPIGLNLLGLVLPKRYTAEMRLLVDESPQNAMAPTGDINQALMDIIGFDRPRSPQTQVDVLTGTEVLGGAMQRAAEALPEKVNLKDDQSVIYENLLRRTAVDNEPNSDILSVRVTQGDPQVAAELANDIGLSYIDYTAKLADQSGAQAEQLLGKQITDTRAQLTHVDAQIKAVKTQSGIYDVTAAETERASTKGAADQRKDQAEMQYRGAVAQLIQAKSLLSTIAPTTELSTQTGENPAEISVEEALSSAEANLAMDQTKYQDDFPAVKQDKQMIKSLQAQLKRMKTMIPAGSSKGPNVVYQTQASTVVQLQAQVDSYQKQYVAAQAEDAYATAQLNQIPAVEAKLAALLRNRTVAEQNYEQLTQRQSLLETAGAARRPTVRIVSTALPPVVATFPDPRLFTIAGLALGTFLAILILMPRPETAEPTEHPRLEAKPEPHMPLLSPEEHEALAAMPLAEEPEAVGSHGELH